MGQTVVDLPDPMQSGGGGGLNAADDLLAQLAGDEVDRLLNETDDGLNERYQVDLRAGAGGGPVIADQDSVVGLPDAALDEMPEESGGDGVSAAGLDELFDQLTESADTPASGEAAIAPPEVVPVIPAGDEAAPLTIVAVEATIARRADDLIEQARRDGAVEEPSAADALAAEMAADEAANAAAVARMNGGAGVVEAELDSVEAGDLTVIDEEAVDYEAEAEVAPRVPVVVRVLEWVNAPLAGLPDGAREGLGKVALVTTVNAVAVLAYVLIFRRG